MNYITSYCKIRDYALHEGERCLFMSQHKRLENFLEMAYQELSVDYPKYFKMDSLSKLGILATEIMLKNRVHQYEDDQIAVVLANTHSSLNTDLQYQRSTQTFPSPSLFVYTLPNIVIGEICIRHRLKGDNEFFVFEKFDPVFMANYVDQLIEDTSAEACLAGWIDVIGEQHDVFLYLVEKQGGDVWEHKASTLMKMYK